MFTCKSVVGGWQTMNAHGQLIGPVFHSTPALWNWQKKNLFEPRTVGNKSIYGLAVAITQEERKQLLTDIWWECKALRCIGPVVTETQGKHTYSHNMFRGDEIVHCRNDGEAVIVTSVDRTHLLRIPHEQAYRWLEVQRRMPASGEGSAQWYAEQALRALYRGTGKPTKAGEEAFIGHFRALAGSK